MSNLGRFGMVAALLAPACAMAGCSSILGADFDRPAENATDGGTDGHVQETDAGSPDAPVKGEGGGDGEAVADTGPSSDTGVSADVLADAPSGPRVLLFGGYAGNSVFDDAWAFDGATWTEECSACGPSARYLGAMATLGSEVLLYAGASPSLPDGGGGALLHDGWRFDGQKWTEACSSCSPPARYREMMATLGNDVVLFGGNGDTGDLQDTWLFDGAAWSKASSTDASTSPPARDTGSMAALGGALVLFAGWTDNAGGTTLRDTWTFDGSIWTEVCATCAPPGRGGAAMATLAGKLVLFGGRDQGTYLGDTWTFDGTTWTQVCASCGPSARFQSRLATLGDRVVLFGGEDASGKKYQDTWTFDGSTWSQVSTPNTPPARAGAMMTSL